MDHKKVDEDNPGIVPLDEDDEPFIFEEGGITPVEFDAEFNDAIFRGDLTGSKGTFSGELSAGAVNVLGRLNFKGGSIARAMMVFDPTDSAPVRDGTYKQIKSAVFVVPADDPQAFVDVRCGFVGYSLAAAIPNAAVINLTTDLRLRILDGASSVVYERVYKKPSVWVWMPAPLTYTQLPGSPRVTNTSYWTQCLRGHALLAPGTYTIVISQKSQAGTHASWNPRTKDIFISAHYFRKY